MIGGNTSIELQTKTAITRNAIGGTEATWTTAQVLFGWLDMLTGSAGTQTFDAKIQESTHVFIGDYVPITCKAEDCRAIDEDGLIYDVTFIDDPMKLHKQIEIFLKFTGGQ